MSRIVARASSGVSAPCSICGLHHAPGMGCPVAATLAVRPAGQVLAARSVLAGRFEIQEVTHHSGMSTVYRALDLQRPSDVVAVKQISVSGLPEDERAEARSWLAREAGLLSSLHHPQLPELLAAFSEGDDHFVVMPFLEGETIQERVERMGPLPEAEVVRWAQTLADVLGYLHGQDLPIIHRDLKPANILLRDYGRLMLLDLGVARPLARGQAGTAIGTPGYAPPEQYQGLADARSDLYALGATLHYMLTGYDAELAAPFRHPPVRQVRPEVSAELDELMTALLRLAPQQRPGDAGLVGRYLLGMDEMRERTVANRLWATEIRRGLLGTASLAGVTTLLTVCVRTHLFGIDIGNEGTILGFLGYLGCGASTVSNRIARRRTRQVDEMTKRAQERVRRSEREILLPGILCSLLCFFVLLFTLPFAVHWLLLWLFPPALGLLLTGLWSACWRASERSVRKARLSLDSTNDNAHLARGS